MPGRAAGYQPVRQAVVGIYHRGVRSVGGGRGDHNVAEDRHPSCGASARHPGDPEIEEEEGWEPYK